MRFNKGFIDVRISHKFLFTKQLSARDIKRIQSNAEQLEIILEYLKPQGASLP